jgi:hypothetical protein
VDLAETPGPLAALVLPMTASSAPTFARIASARAICSGVCAAEQLARSTQSSCGQPGGTIRFT